MTMFALSRLAAAVVLLQATNMAAAQDVTTPSVVAAPELAARMPAVAPVAPGKAAEEAGTLVHRWVYRPTIDLASGIGSTTSWLMVSLYEGAYGATQAVVSGTADLGRSTSETLAGYFTGVSEATTGMATSASAAVVTPVMAATTDAAGHLKLAVVDPVAERTNRVMATVSRPMLTSRDFAERLKHQSFREFERLVEKTGFTLTGVEVGVGIIPDVSVEFEHVHSLTEEQRKEAAEAIEEHGEKHSGLYAYAQGIMLRRLLNASEFAEELDIAGVEVHVFPLPGMDIRFDPFEHEKHEQVELENLAQREGSLARREMSTRARLMALERAFAEYVASNPAPAAAVPVAQ